MKFEKNAKRGRRPQRRAAEIGCVTRIPYLPCAEPECGGGGGGGETVGDEIEQGDLRKRGRDA